MLTVPPEVGGTVARSAGALRGDEGGAGCHAKGRSQQRAERVRFKCRVEATAWTVQVVGAV